MHGVKQLQERIAPGGGFAMQPGGDFRPDATAWAVIALQAWGESPELIEAARQRLAAVQLQDGRVSISPLHPESYWPTPLAVLAWHGAAAYREVRERAVAFLLAASGVQWHKMPEDVVGHDPTLKGWSWRLDTVPWSEPTAMSMMALDAAGQGEHPRLEEARRLLLDRQLPGGGWNYGNTTVFGQALKPMPESTGMVLNALARKVPPEAVQKSIAYLEKRATSLKTPRALGWALLGLGAWGAKPTDAKVSVQNCLACREPFEGYDTSSLALLLVAFRATDGLMSVLPA
ncbi:MAG: prenyltransferase/squalene oxidase repeat-containing protein [Desulfobaccales bacterium]